MSVLFLPMLRVHRERKNSCFAALRSLREANHPLEQTRNLCPECAAFFARKVSRPDPAKVLIEVYQMVVTWSGRKYGVSLKA
jgi:hypothetical protein